MKAAIYTPYLDTLGGGERYMLSIAQALLEEGYVVDIETDSPEIVRKAEERFELDLKHARAVRSVSRGDGYDICVWLSDGSVPMLAARKNILHFQRPFSNVDGKNLINRMKFFRIAHVIVNSNFTKRFIDKEYPKESIVLYPPVSIKKFKPSRKKEQICYIGRFSRLGQAKRQDVLVEAFRKLYRKGYKHWKLTLAGGSDVGRDELLETLTKSSSNLPIEIMENAPFSEIRKVMSESSFFWSASGYGVDQKLEPEKLEHFGMTVVEAMASGAVPLVFDGGGHGEIITTGMNGVLWRKPEELVSETVRLIEDNKSANFLSKNAIKSSSQYSYEEFKKNFLSLI